MRAFQCTCGQPLFFHSTNCVACSRTVRFDPTNLNMVTLTKGRDNTLTGSHGETYFSCDNQVALDNCNWLVAANHGPGLCHACNFNRVIPNLSFAANKVRWNKIEAAKKRLIYTLLAMNLPVTSGHSTTSGGLLFDFVEDARTNPNAFGDQVRNTGYLAGVITINVVEADDAARESQRVAANEQYRTVLGHLRHEIGHYFFERKLPTHQATFDALFGDPMTPYQTSLDTYYANGPQKDWQQYCISAYASAHPLEDWAETCGHYLHISDVLETALSHQVVDIAVANAGIRQRISAWRKLSIVLNELNRSVGHTDVYPFVLNDAVADKLVFVDQVIRDLQVPQQGLANR